MFSSKFGEGGRFPKILLERGHARPYYEGMNSPTVPAPGPELEAGATSDVCLYLLVALGGIDELAPQPVPVFAEKE